MNNKIAENNELTDDEVQLSILTMLFNKRREQPNDTEVLRTKLVEVLGIPEEKVVYNAGYLEEKQLIDFVESAEGKWIWAKITAMGIDAINNKEGKKKILKFLGVKIPIHIENKIAFINFNF